MRSSVAKIFLGYERVLPIDYQINKSIDRKHLLLNGSSQCFYFLSFRVSVCVFCLFHTTLSRSGALIPPPPPPILLIEPSNQTHTAQHKIAPNYTHATCNATPAPNTCHVILTTTITQTVSSFINAQSKPHITIKGNQSAPPACSPGDGAWPFSFFSSKPPPPPPPPTLLSPLPSPSPSPFRCSPFSLSPLRRRFLPSPPPSSPALPPLLPLLDAQEASEGAGEEEEEEEEPELLLERLRFLLSFFRRLLSFCFFGGGG
jgi:hypothetical protein